ncbi:hypothetical protein KPATCC21470_5068 [Kitasatospora purpeofusca]
MARRGRTAACSTVRRRARHGWFPRSIARSRFGGVLDKPV